MNSFWDCFPLNHSTVYNWFNQSNFDDTWRENSRGGREKWTHSRASRRFRRTHSRVSRRFRISWTFLKKCLHCLKMTFTLWPLHFDLYTLTLLQLHNFFFKPFVFFLIFKFIFFSTLIFYINCLSIYCLSIKKIFNTLETFFDKYYSL